MNPYRQAADRPAQKTRVAGEEIVVTIAVLALGILGLVIGIAYGRTTEAGLGVAVTIFGAYAARALLRQC